MGGEDGRRLRRERNRQAVVAAVLEIIMGGDLEPTAEAVAARAGLSTRSLFRYFDDIDDLRTAAVASQRQRADVILAAELDIDDHTPRAERIAAVVDQRLLLFDTMSTVGQFARLRAPFQPMLAEQLHFARATLRARLARACRPELTGLGPDTADALVAAGDVMCSFEAYRLLVDDQERTRDGARHVMVSGLTALLAPVPAPAA